MHIGTVLYGTYEYRTLQAPHLQFSTSTNTDQYNTMLYPYSTCTRPARRISSLRRSLRAGTSMHCLLTQLQRNYSSTRRTCLDRSTCTRSSQTPGFNTESTLSACSCECCERAAITPTKVGVWHRTEEPAQSERRLQLPISCTHALRRLALLM